MALAYYAFSLENRYEAKPYFVPGHGIPDIPALSTDESLKNEKQINYYISTEIEKQIDFICEFKDFRLPFKTPEIFYCNLNFFDFHERIENRSKTEIDTFINSLQNAALVQFNYIQ